MAESRKLAFETLTTDEVGRRLKTQSGRFEVAAKIAMTEDGESFVVVRLWIASEPGPRSEGWSEPSSWSHTVYDLDHNMVAYGFGARERDSWAMAEKVLARKLSWADPEDAGPPDLSAAKANTDPAAVKIEKGLPYDEYGNPTQEGWTPIDPSGASRFVWGPEDVDILSEEEARAVLGDEVVDESRRRRDVPREN